MQKFARAPMVSPGHMPNQAIGALNQTSNLNRMSGTFTPYSRLLPQKPNPLAQMKPQAQGMANTQGIQQAMQKAGLLNNSAQAHWLEALIPLLNYQAKQASLGASGGSASNTSTNSGPAARNTATLGSSATHAKPNAALGAQTTQKSKPNAVARKSQPQAQGVIPQQVQQQGQVPGLLPNVGVGAGAGIGAYGVVKPGWPSIGVKAASQSVLLEALRATMRGDDFESVRPSSNSGYVSGLGTSGASLGRASHALGGSGTIKTAMQPQPTPGLTANQPVPAGPPGQAPAPAPLPPMPPPNGGAPVAQGMGQPSLDPATGQPIQDAAAPPPEQGGDPMAAQQAGPMGQPPPMDPISGAPVTSPMQDPPPPPLPMNPRIAPPRPAQPSDHAGMHMMQSLGHQMNMADKPMNMNEAHEDMKSQAMAMGSKTAQLINVYKVADPFSDPMGFARRLMQELAKEANHYDFHQEDCPHCKTPMEGDTYTGTCNHCGKKWGTKKAGVPVGGSASYDYHCKPCDHSFDGPDSKCPLCRKDRAITKQARALGNVRTKLLAGGLGLGGLGLTGYGAYKGLSGSSPTALSTDAIPRTGAVVAPGTRQVTLPNLVSDYYGKIQGGFDGAVQSAIGARSKFKTPSYTNLNFTRKSLDKPIGVEVLDDDIKMVNSNVSHGGETRAAYDIPSDTAIVSGKPSVASRRSSLEHEATHGRLQGPEFFAGRTGGTAPMRNLLGTQNRTGGTHDPAYQANINYVGSSAETDVRLAQIKRLYAKHMGELADTPEKANAALQWYQDKGHTLDPGSVKPDFDYGYMNQPEPRRKQWQDEAANRMTQVVRGDTEDTGMKVAAQADDGSHQPKRSAVGESTGLSLKHSDWYAHGQKAWDNISTYQRSHLKKSKPNPQIGKHAFDTCTPFARGFFEACVQQGMDLHRAVEKVGSDFGPEAENELRDGLEKIAGPWDKIITEGSKQVMPRVGNFMKGLFGGSNPVVPAAAKLRQAAPSMPMPQALNQARQAVGGGYQAGQQINKAVAPIAQAAGGVAKVVAPQVGRTAGGAFVGGMSGDDMGLGGEHTTIGYGPLSFQFNDRGMLAGAAASNPYLRQKALGRGYGRGTADIAGATFRRGAAGGFAGSGVDNALDAFGYGQQAMVDPQTGKAMIDPNTGKPMMQAGNTFARLGAMGGMASGGLGRGAARTARGMGAAGTTGVNPLRKPLAGLASTETRAGNAVSQFGQGTFDPLVGGMKALARKPIQWASGGKYNGPGFLQATKPNMITPGRTAGRVLGGATMLGTGVGMGGQMLNEKLNNTVTDMAGRTLAEGLPLVGEYADQYMQERGMLNEQGQFDPTQAFDRKGGLMGKAQRGIDQMLAGMGMDPSRMSPLQKLMLVGGVGAGGAGLASGNPFLAGTGGIAAGAGLMPYLLSGDPQAGQHFKTLTQGPNAPTMGGVAQPQARNEWEHQQQTQGG